MLPPDSNGSSHITPQPNYLETEHPPAQSKTVKVIIWIVVLAVFAAAFVLIEKHKSVPSSAGGGGGGRRGAAGGTVVLTPATATAGNIGVYVNAIGTVTPVYTATIMPQVSGPIIAVHYAEGQMVGKGTPLVDIDPRPYQAQVMQAEGTLERDQNLLAQAQMDADRYQKAWEKNAIPKQTLDDQQKVVLQDQGTVKLDEGVLQYDKVQLSYCHIVSPISGKVGLRLVDPGNVVTANTTAIAVVTQMQPITVIFSIPEDSLAQVSPRLRQHAKLPVDALDRTDANKVGSGTLITLDNQIDTTTGTVKARALFANSDNALYPNAFVNARLLVNTEQNVTLVPSSVIQHNGTTAYVYLIQDNVAHMRTVKEGVTDAGNTAVTGIDPGDVIANSGFEKLQDGSKIQIAGKGKGGKSGSKPATSDNTTSSGSTAP
jgi:multidrug efflux system membrane fusion protein